MTDAKLDHLKSILDQLLDVDDDITFRGVLRISDQFKNTTDLTRPVLRRRLVEDYQARQTRMRELAGKMDKNAKSKLLARLANAERDHDSIERQREFLIVAVRGLIRSVGKAKGLKGWVALFPDYCVIHQELKSMGALPSAEVLSMKRPGALDEP